MEPSGFLLPPPNHQMEGLRAGETLEDVYHRALGDLDVRWIRLPMRDREGIPAPPPEEHVADHLARAWALDDEDYIIEHSPVAAGTVEVLSYLPDCDICGAEAQARYFGVTDIPNLGRHYRRFCVGCLQYAEHQHLGSEGCVYYMLLDEVTDALADKVDDRLIALSRSPLFARRGKGSPG